jgi:hypothetical protein
MTIEQVIAILTAISAMVTAFFGNKIKKGSDDRAAEIKTSISDEALGIAQQITALSIGQVRLKKELRDELKAEIEAVRIQVEQIAKSSANNRDLLESMREQLQRDIKNQIDHNMEPMKAQAEWINDFMVKVRSSKVVGGK